MLPKNFIGTVNRVPLISTCALALYVNITPTQAADSASTTPTTSSTPASATVAYPIVDTGQTKCYDNTTESTCPATGASFYGQDAQSTGTQPAYTLSSDSKTVYDNNTGLTWMRGPNTTLATPVKTDKMTYTAAQAWVTTVNSMNYGGYSDWRLPTIKELYSLIQFNGTDPSGYSGTDTSALTPFIDTTKFNFAYGQTSSGERIIDSQYASSNVYVFNPSDSGYTKLFGVNFADGRIKGYDLKMPDGSEKTFFVQLVRGNTNYGVNNFTDNSDQTITDNATKLMWSKSDNGSGLNWQEALAYVQTKNTQNYLGHNDWRMPNAKELQSILDYTRAPDTTSSAAINPLFTMTPITNEAGKVDYPWYWANTTHGAYNSMGSGIYIAFGRAGGWQKATTTATCYTFYDVHGAGAQRSDPKTTNGISTLGSTCSGGTAYGFGPQGDVQRAANYVRLVRDVSVTTSTTGTTATTATTTGTTATTTTTTGTTATTTGTTATTATTTGTTATTATTTGTTATTATTTGTTATITGTSATTATTTETTATTTGTTATTTGTTATTPTSTGTTTTATTTGTTSTTSTGTTSATGTTTTPVTTTGTTTTTPATTSTGTTTGTTSTNTPQVTPITTSSTPTTTSSTAVANTISNCTGSSSVSDSCNAGGKTIKVTEIKPSGTLANGILNNAVTSQGWVSNVTLTANGKLVGGVVTGYIKNQGVIMDFEFKGMSIIGGTLGGVITNTSQVGGYFQDVTLQANTKIKGGILKGTIKGDKQSPALLENVKVKAGSHLSGVKLGTGVKLEKGAVVEPLEETQTTPTTTLPSLGQALATDAKGQPVTTKTEMTGGISLDGAKTFKPTGEAKQLSETVAIDGHLQVDPAHVKQKVSIFVTVTYQPTQDSQEKYHFKLDAQGGLMPWTEGDLASLGQDPFQSAVTLPATFDVAMYHGVLLATGLIQVHFGYLLPDGTVVQSQQPLELTVAK